MKLLLVTASDDTFNHISRSLKGPEFELIRYRYIHKAMDNIDEADPGGIIISANDFPRHWKTMVQFVRTERSRDQCPIVLLKGDKFPREEADKAVFLGVNGVVPEAAAETGQIRELLTYTPKGKTERTKTGRAFAFMFTGPREKIITGTVRSISKAGLSFEPDRGDLVKDLKPGAKIPLCSLRAGEALLSPVCTLKAAGKIISLEFLSFPGDEKESLDIFLEILPPEPAPVPAIS